MKLSLDKRPFSGLKPYKHNSKKHTEEQIDMICASIRRFGFNDPIGILPDGTIIEGEGRYRACEKLGMTEVPVVILDDLDERDADLYRIAHNKIAQTSGFDVERLVTELRDLTKKDISLSQLGFTEINAQTLYNMFPVDGEEYRSARRTQTRITFDLIWDDPQQKKEWTDFIKTLKGRYGDELTVVELLREFKSEVELELEAPVTEEAEAYEQ